MKTEDDEQVEGDAIRLEMAERANLIRVLHAEMRDIDIELRSLDLRRRTLEFRRYEVGHTIGMKNDEQKEAKIRLARLSASAAKSGGLVVSDHAIVRYLQRVMGQDITALRKEIAEWAVGPEADVLIQDDRSPWGPALVTVYGRRTDHVEDDDDRTRRCERGSV